MGEVVYIVINEYQPTDSDNSSSDVVLATMSLQKALDYINAIAVDMEYAKHGEDTGMSLNIHESDLDSHLDWETYYVTTRTLA